ncbi:cyclin-dependent kinase 4 inhibitor C [Chanos chanos]|uniref:Cyclin-dependent kinase 4 inhibitor C n=1 Tax=Chanos chanos TaxID=29144 RepID=A0A6J2W7N4_CHACN|nr:cyclin-dependent kinase 4 inhibitor C [Chanos chanos]
MAGSTDANMLTSAAARGDIEEIETMLQRGVDVNERNEFGRTALQVMKLGNPDIARVLLTANADPNVRDPIRGLTITHDAARDGYIDTLQVLVEHGADVNILDSEDNLPLHLAAREGHLRVVRFLFQWTRHPSHINVEGHAPYDLARIHNRQSTALWLESMLQQNN